MNVLLFCWFVLVSLCVGAVNGLGYCKRRKREGGGIEEKKKSVENRDGIFLLGFSLFCFRCRCSDWQGREEAQTGRAVLSFLFLFFLSWSRYLPYLALLSL